MDVKAVKRFRNPQVTNRRVKLGLTPLRAELDSLIQLLAAATEGVGGVDDRRGNLGEFRSLDLGGGQQFEPSLF